MNQKIYALALGCFLLLLNACNTETPPQAQPNQESLSAWKDTPLKQKMKDFITKASVNIPVEDRIAVFDMDGTVLCETPLWVEMYAAVYGLNKQSSLDSTLMKRQIYQWAAKVAANPKDTSVTNHWGDSITTMVLTAYKGWDHETYVDTARDYLFRDVNPDFSIPVGKLFYKPMIQLIKLLQENQFQVFIVSGSMQGVIWAVGPDYLPLDRNHLIGTRQAINPVTDSSGKKMDFVIQADTLPPKNDGLGKAKNIYSHIGKHPVFAFGNTTGDFGMFHITTASTYPNMSILLNHNDSIREYKYNPWHGKPDPSWRDSMSRYGWHIADMKEEFQEVWLESN